MKAQLLRHSQTVIPETIILGIESSCDETAAALVRSDRKNPFSSDCLFS